MSSSHRVSLGISVRGTPDLVYFCPLLSVNWVRVSDRQGCLEDKHFIPVCWLYRTPACFSPSIRSTWFVANSKKSALVLQWRAAIGHCQSRALTPLSRWLAKKGSIAYYLSISRVVSWSSPLSIPNVPLLNIRALMQNITMFFMRLLLFHIKAW